VTITTDRPASTETFDSLDPATGEVLARHPIAGAEAVAAAVARAREGAAWWREQGWKGRRASLRAWRTELAGGIDDLAELVHRENGKPRADAILEITLAVEHLAWAARHAPRVLGSRRVRSGLLAANQVSLLEYQPLGVIGVIGPWNYPVFTPMGSIAYALAAGNAVVFKPSEYTPGVGVWLGEAWRRAVPERPDVLQVVTGLGPTGAALCRCGVDKIPCSWSAAARTP
jgi:acyl-CoA reductase-like NAD-dependent aldehyde dehydrogenase